MNAKNGNFGWKWLAKFAVTCLIFATGIAIFQITIDPFGIWDTRKIDGWNHVKNAQRGYDTLFKPYQYVNQRPRVLIIGNSRAYFGMPPQWNIKEGAPVYNLSLQAARLGEIKDLVDFTFASVPPKTVVLMLNPLLLTNSPTGNDKHRDGTLRPRLAALSGSALGALLFKLKETAFSFDALRLSIETIKESKVATNPLPLHKQGWHQHHGLTPHRVRSRYLKNFWRFHIRANKMVGTNPHSFAFLNQIVSTVRKNGARLVVVLEPVSSDFLLSFDSHARIPRLDNMKRHISNLTNFWDFAYVNAVTKRRKSYIDASHFRGVVGEKIISRIVGRTNQVPPDFGVFVTKKNIENHLRICQNRLSSWKEKQVDMVKLLRETKHKSQENQFKNRLGKIAF